MYLEVKKKHTHTDTDTSTERKNQLRFLSLKQNKLVLENAP